MKTLIFSTLAISFLFIQCTQNMTHQEETTEEYEFTNHLINSTSPYLLQHAHNPVDWYPWGPEALNKAKEENKPILLSIGYSSCHWCHVMAHESFENEEIARLMNERFINIKLDREERPDLDNIYMDAVQAMGLRGGWPLNVFITPDQKPFYGGTYFPPDQWKKLIVSVSDAYEHKYDQLYESASQFAANIDQSEAEKYGLTDGGVTLTLSDFDTAYDSLKNKFDPEWGGMNRAPKFPMPALWNFLLTYSHTSGQTKAREHCLLTLDKIASGGIYDHVGGGFSRYSVDGEWHVPHFEKMLYDNGQLLSLYANAYKLTGKSEYKRVLTGIAQWLQREMLHEQGGFYSALDADSEGEEGKFYVWTFEEVKELAGGDFSVIAEYYNVTKEGNWEPGKNVLRKLEDDKVLATELNLSVTELRDQVEQFNAKALAVRNTRVRPGLDNKLIAGWNGLALTGLCHSYQATGESIFEDLATENAAFISQQLVTDKGLVRIYGLDTRGYLEDYAAVIQAFITYYETFFDETYLELARTMTNQVIDEFFDQKENLFYYTSNQAEHLIARKKEIFDNVIPASNSIMAENLHKLGLMYDDESYKKIAFTMIYQVNKLIRQEPEYLSNWASISLLRLKPTAEMLLVGAQAREQALQINKTYLPNKILMASTTGSSLPLFEYKTVVGNETTIYVCFDKVCKRPVNNFTDALAEIHDPK